jgi:MoxR-like ATPase
MTSTQPWFQTTAPQPPQIKGEDIPTRDPCSAENPALYVASEPLAHAVNVALTLGMPLLLMGPPGTGKTSLARTIAYQLQCPLLPFETRSSSQARDLFYTYDSLSAFKTPGEIDHRDFIEFQALGRAILDAFPRDNKARQNLIKDSEAGHKPHRSVVLIDEIDKAPRDFPNDMLNEIEKFFFRVPELGNLSSPGLTGEAMDPKLRPIVIITSNDERGLPAAFLRRCLFFHIDFPGEYEMKGIVTSRLGNELDLGAGAALPVAISDVIKLFYDVRQSLSAPGSEGPSTAELLDWIQYLLRGGLDVAVPLARQGEMLLASTSIIAKSEDAGKRAHDAFKDYVSGKGS